MTFADVELVKRCSGDWPDLAKEFPEFNDDVALPACSFVEHNEKQSLQSKDWDADKIGALPKSALFYNGLFPNDFLRAFHDRKLTLEQVCRHVVHASRDFRRYTRNQYSKVIGATEF